MLSFIRNFTKGKRVAGKGPVPKGEKYRKNQVSHHKEEVSRIMDSVIRFRKETAAKKVVIR